MLPLHAVMNASLMHLSLLCPTLPGWWWVGILKGVKGLTPAACPLGGAFALYGELLLYIRTFV